jgi:hypothetical protein
VPVTADMPEVSIGESVSIVLPSQTTTPGLIAGIGPLPAAAGLAAGSPAGGSTSGGAGTGAAQGATSFLFITPVTPAATGTGDSTAVQVSLAVQVAHGVLAAPVSALLALAGGGYGVEVVLPSGTHRLVGVRTGLFAGGLVQVSGSGITAGTRVVVSQ